MLYRQWLNLNVHLLWCHNQPAVKGWKVTGPTLRFTQYRNSGAWLVQEGWARVEHDGRCHTAQPGQWLIVKPGPRVQTFASHTRLLSIAFEATWPDGSHLFDEGLSLVLDAAEAPTLERQAEPLLRTMSAINPETWDARRHPVNLRRFLLLERALCDWLMALSSVLSHRGIQHSGQVDTDPRVSEAVELLNACELGETLDLAELASRVGLSLNHLTRLFRRDLDTTPHEYWDRRRIEYARGRLVQPGARAKEVCYELGFTYLSHFSAWFKKRTGISPRGVQQGFRIG